MEYWSVLKSMGLFGKKEPKATGIIGVDIGAGGIRAVELNKEKGRMRLLTYGYSTSNSHESTSPLIDDAKKAAKILQDIMKKSDIKSIRVNASLPSHSIFHAIITIPAPKDKKQPIKPLIENQVKKLLPMPIEEMILDSTIIDKEKVTKVEEGKKDTKKEAPSPKEGQPRGSSKHIRVLVSGAPKTLVAKYVSVFKLAKVQLASLETEAFALIRSLVGKDKSRIMVVDIGYERTNISIVDKGLPFLHRSIKAGGMNVTKMIAKQMGISDSEAEQTKMDLAVGKQQNIPPVLKEAMMPILHEIKYSLQLFNQQAFHNNSTVEKIIITGGSAHLPQIDSFLSEALNINVYLGDPWARVATPVGLRPVLDEIGPRFAVAVGLAMKELEGK